MISNSFVPTPSSSTAAAAATLLLQPRSREVQAICNERFETHEGLKMRVVVQAVQQPAAPTCGRARPRLLA
jgi:hypothetical protein